MGKIYVTDEQIIEASKTSNSASEAASKLKIQYNTYKRHAERLGVFRKNQGGKGKHKPILDERKFPLQDILEGLHPQYQSNKLRKRLLEENIFDYKCSSCGLSVWLEKFPIPLELDHIDGDKSNNKLENLRLLCPNCHTLTETYKSKNRSRAWRNRQTQRA